MFISKRLLLIIGILVVVVMLAAGIGLAYAFSALGQQSATNANISATVTASALASPTPGNGQRRVTGVIKSLDNQSFVLAANQGKRMITVEVDAQTKYVRGGKSASFSDLQPGETVVVLGTYDASSKTMTATRVTIVSSTSTPTPSPTAAP